MLKNIFVTLAPAQLLKENNREGFWADMVIYSPEITMSGWGYQILWVTLSSNEVVGVEIPPPPAIVLIHTHLKR